MQLATVLTPITDQALEWSAQCGVTDLVHRYPGKDIHPLRAAIDHAGQYGLRISVIEGYLPIENIKLGVDDGRELEAMKTLIRQMGDLGIGILCYNFMAGTDWTRTRLDVPARGNARVTEFRKADAEQAVLLGYHPTNPNHETIARKLSPDALWQHLQRTLDELLPIAEACSVTLAMHPDDPPLPQMLGKPRIMCDLDAFEKLMQLAPSRANSICFCQGTFATMGVDIPAAIRQLGSHIRYVHFRDVKGDASAFTETFHDDGPTDMAEAMRAYYDIGLNGPIRPDHVPQLSGEEDGEPGYTMLGRFFAFGYIRGLMHAAGYRK